jgi:hypothetical protein
MYVLMPALPEPGVRWPGPVATYSGLAGDDFERLACGPISIGERRLSSMSSRSSFAAKLIARVLRG